MPAPIHHHGEFAVELEARMREFFTVEKRFATIGRRALTWSLVDFPIVMVNFPFFVGSVLVKSIALPLRSAGRFKKCADWLRHPGRRSGRIARRLPPYRTMSARAKLKAFKRMVIDPVEQTHATQVRTLDLDKLEDILTQTLTSWEKIPNIMEQILTPFCWMLGVTFLGLDPKTVVLMSRNETIYHRWEALGRSWFGKVYLRVKWMFVDSIPWTYSFKFIAVGLIAYMLLMAMVEFVSVQIIYRKGAEKKLIDKICVHFNDIKEV
jgi:hypothetical protein